MSIGQPSERIITDHAIRHKHPEALTFYHALLSNKSKMTNLDSYEDSPTKKVFPKTKTDASSRSSLMAEDSHHL